MDSVAKQAKSEVEVQSLSPTGSCKGCKYLKPGYFGYCRFFDKPTSGKPCDSYKAK